MAYIGIDANGNRMKVATGNGTASSTENYKIELGFKPKYIAFLVSGSTSSWSAGTVNIYNADISTTQFFKGTSSTALSLVDIGNAPTGSIVSIDNDGFTMAKSSNIYPYKYFAIG